jgi:septum formation topological specificity factor MinE
MIPVDGLTIEVLPEKPNARATTRKRLMFLLAKERRGSRKIARLMVEHAKKDNSDMGP